MLPILTFVLVLGFGQERPVAPLQLAPVNAASAAAATNGRSQLIAWKANNESLVYAQLLDDSLALRAPQGILLGRSSGAFPDPIERVDGVATDGDGYVVLWHEVQKLWAVHVSAAGEPSPPRLVASLSGPRRNFEQPRIASNGAGYLVSWIDWSLDGASAVARRLDRSGAPTENAFLLTDSRTDAYRNHLVSNGSGYLAILDIFDLTSQTFPHAMMFVPITAAGRVETVRTVATEHYIAAAVYDGTSSVLATTRRTGTESILSVMPILANAGLGEPHEVARVTGTDRIYVDGFASNGNGSLLLIRSSQSFPLAMRFAPGGTPLDAAPRALPVAAPSIGFHFAARAPLGQYFLGRFWPLSGAPIPASLDTETLITPRPLAFEPVPQSRPRVAPIGDSHVVAYFENSTLRANGAVMATDLRLWNVALASDGARVLVAWATPQAIQGRFAGAAGPLSDPFTIATTADAMVHDAVAVDGGFVVLYETGTRLWLVRTGSAPFEIPLPAPARRDPYYRNPALARTTNGFLLIYNDHTGIPDAIRLMAFRADGAPAGPLRTLAETGGVELGSGHVASDGEGRLLAVWSTWSSVNFVSTVRAVPLDDEGRIAGEERVVGTGNRPRVSWTGSEFVVVAEGSIAAVSRGGEVLMPLTPLLGNIPEPNIGGRAIVYERGNQVMIRTLGTLRRRTAR